MIRFVYRVQSSRSQGPNWPRRKCFPRGLFVRGVQAMHYTVQFLDASATVIEEWHADANDVAGAIALIEGVSWPLDAVRMRILEPDGREVHERVKAEGR